MPIGIVILYFLVVVDRGKHSRHSNPFLLKYEAIDEGHASSSEINLKGKLNIQSKTHKTYKLPTVRFPTNK